MRLLDRRPAIGYNRGTTTANTRAAVIGSRNLFTSYRACRQSARIIRPVGCGRRTVPYMMWALCVKGQAQMKRTWATETATRQVAPRTKDIVFERDSYTCVYCDGMASTVDHIIPWSYSNDHSLENLVACCDECNGLASDKMFTGLLEKRRYIQERREQRIAYSFGHSLKMECPYCGRVFKPGITGTNICCNRCANE